MLERKNAAESRLWNRLDFTAVDVLIVNDGERLEESRVVCGR